MSKKYQATLTEGEKMLNERLLNEIEDVRYDRESGVRKTNKFRRFCLNVVEEQEFKQLKRKLAEAPHAK